MSCVLRVRGIELDVDDCLAHVNFTPIVSWHKGGPQFDPRPEGPKMSDAGFHVSASEADGDKVPLQIEELLAFIEKHENSLRHIADRDDVEQYCFDFDWWLPVTSVMQYNLFPPKLLRLLGELGITMVVTVGQTDFSDDKSLLKKWRGMLALGGLIAMKRKRAKRA